MILSPARAFARDATPFVLAANFYLDIFDRPGWHLIKLMQSRLIPYAQLRPLSLSFSATGVGKNKFILLVLRRPCLFEI
jgi:hypothetical protein